MEGNHWMWGLALPQDPEGNANHAYGEGCEDFGSLPDVGVAFRYRERNQDKAEDNYEKEDADYVQLPEQCLKETFTAIELIRGLVVIQVAGLLGFMADPPERKDQGE